MRILEWSQQYDVMEEVRSIFRESGYLFENSEWARIISGKDEVNRKKLHFRELIYGYQLII